MEEELKKLISEKKVIPFVGAGVSKAVKFKDSTNAFVDWKELLEKFLDKIDNKKSRAIIEALLIEDDENPINYLEVADKIEKSLGIKDFNDVMKNTFNIDYNNVDESSYELAKEIWNLGSKLIITTNYDKVLHQACEDKNLDFWDISSIYEQATSLRDGLTNSTVWNLHGHIGNVNNLILTSKKYNELYTKNVMDSKYKESLQTLQNIISSNSLLFIGFSLDDKFIKKQIQSTIDIFGGNSCEHYILVKKGHQVDKLGGNIKIIEYENYGQPLIDKIKSLQPSSEDKEIKAIQQSQKIPAPKIEKYNPRLLTDLPPKNENFVGRVDDLKTISEKLQDESITYIVNGIGGVGKSDLAVKYLLDNQDRYNKVAFMEFTKETLSIEDMFYTKFKEKLQLDKDDNFSTIIRKLQELSAKNLLLIDNLEDKEDFEKIKPLNHNFDLLITTRRTDIEAKHQLPLNTLNDEDAKELFLSIYDKDKNIEDILIYLDNHPLFINLTAKSLDKEYITLEELRENIKNNSIEKIDSTDEKTFKEHLQDTFDRQFKKEQNEELKKLLQILSIFPSIEIDFEVFEKSIAIEKLKFKLQKLVERGWLSKKENSYKLHQIIKTFIQTNYQLQYEEINFVFENIGDYIDPEDSILIANQLKHYIPIIEYFLTTYKKIEDNSICKLYDSLTYLCYSLAKYDISLSYQTKSFEIRKKLFDENSEWAAKSYALLSTIFLVKGDLEEAEEYQKSALKVREKIFGDEHSDIASSYNNLSLIYKERGLIEKALEYQQKALILGEKILGIKHPSIATYYNNLSLIYRDKKKVEIALEYQNKALELREKILGKEHPNVARSYNNLSSIYKDKGDIEKALEYQKRSIKISEKILGKEHPDVARSYSNISVIYLDKKECIKAIECIKKAINIWEQTDYYKKDLFNARQFLKHIEFNIKKEGKAKLNKKGKICKDL